MCTTCDLPAGCDLQIVWIPAAISPVQLLLCVLCAAGFHKLPK